MQITLHGANNNENIITIKIAAQMNEKSRMLKVGLVMYIHSYKTIFFDYVKLGK